MCLVKGSSDSSDALWKVHAFGEDAERVSQQESNSYAMRLGDRLHQQLG